MRKWDGTPVEPLLSALVEFLLTLAEGHALTFSYSALCKAAETSMESSTFQAAVSVLVSSRSLHLLDIHYILDDGNEEYELADKDVAHARRTGKLAHPETGVVIEDYERFVYPYFEASNTLREARNRA
jgi:hypothetical protein